MGASPAAEPVGRIRAWLLDWLVILAWVALTTVVGAGLWLAGLRLGPVGLNLIATVSVVLPVCVGFALLEAGPAQATWGKRRHGLRVVRAADGGRIGLVRAMVRNLIKIGVPWSLGHAVAIALATGSDWSVGLGLATVLAYGLPALFVLMLILPGHRPPYDLVAGTVVVAESGEAPGSGR